MKDSQKWAPARRDPAALSFGIAFVLLGVLGVLRASGRSIDADALSQVALVGLGVAGLVALIRRR